ncbi:GNAT family N-acetyltransferase [Micromonospora costi]|uniref:GNAT family N-acetyltransferase n=1 Tax=Micromonospora costi TaxID=1530042 RepID=A0A3A9ZWP5_9ACTN|nr:GNAT family N-acetyltransferase [Micromonospora costi]RKN52755.1 GNAT family N-acetyltransferase [Micromonospora costi]
MWAPAEADRATVPHSLQERAARALPAEHVTRVDGWWLRHAPRCSWWVGSVLPHGPADPGQLAHRVATAERFYANRDGIARFQICPGACPDGLDGFLAARGYRLESPMSLQVASTAAVADATPPDAPPVRTTDRPTTDWFEVWHAVHGDGTDPGAERAMLDRVDRPAAYACAVLDGDVVAVGRAVADTGWAGMFGMATLPGVRGRGAARAVLAGLAGWAAGHRADRLYLQVERGNAPALRLYGRAGFRERYGYHYRVAD